MLVDSIGSAKSIKTANLRGSAWAEITGFSPSSQMKFPRSRSATQYRTVTRWAKKMNTVIIDIAGTIKELLKWVAVQVLIFLAVVGVGLSAPFLFSVGALWLAWRYAEYAWIWAVIYLTLGPFACSFWMILLSAKLATQHSDDDPLNRSLMATAFMVVGFFGSLLAEGVFTYAAHRLSVIPNHLMSLFFVFAPLAVFAPCWLVVPLSPSWQHERLA